MRSAIIGTLMALGISTGAMANQASDTMRNFMQNNIAGWASDPVIVAAITEQNAKTAGMDQSAIDQKDSRWRADVHAPSSELIDSVLDNAAANFLRKQVAASGGAITEAFVMDALGLNVAASAATSDYWQGDEAKFTETYARGSGAHHFGDLELDDSTGEVQGQISMAITDPATGKVIGALTVGVAMRHLM